MEEKFVFKTELHAHVNPVSRCSDIAPEELADIYKAKGYDAVVVTNHFIKGFTTPEAFLESYEQSRLAGKRAGIEMLLGMEIRFVKEGENDYLVYGLTEEDVFRAWDYLDGTLEDFYRGFKREDILIIQAHPFRSTSTPRGEDVLDGIEVFNLHPNHNSRVGLAAAYAARHPAWITTGGTDFHHHGHEAMCAMLTRTALKQSKEVVAALKTKEYRLLVGNHIIMPFEGK